jgi:hypothetical protein
LETKDPNQLDEEYDVIVAGGGAAALAAAVASAREGMKTLLHTKLPSIGGFGGSTIVHSLCGLYAKSPDMIPRPANGGFAMEFAERLLKFGCASGPLRAGPFDILLNEPLPYTRFCHDFCQREKNLTVALETRVELIEGSDSHFDKLFFEGRQGPVRAKAFVDTTREAEIAFLGGAEYETSVDRPVKRRTFVLCVSNQEVNATSDENLRFFSDRIVSGIRSGELAPQMAMVAIKIARLDREWNACIRLDDEGDHFSALNQDSLIRFQILGGNLTEQLCQFLRANVPGFEKCRVDVVPSHPCAPESRRLVGRHRLSPEDLQSNTDFEDAVCRLAWPIMADPMIAKESTSSANPLPPPGVPLRSLLSKNITNFVVAGRCVSSSYVVQGALRVAGAALSLGQAAGLAAAEIARSSSLSIPEGSEPETASKIRAELEKGL